jgi:hypothetical protein
MKYASPPMTAIHRTATRLTARSANVRHKLYMDNLLSSPELFEDLHNKTTNSCVTIRLNRKGILINFREKIMLKDNINTWVRANLTAKV